MPLYPAAERFDLAARDFARDDDGTLVNEHEVDACVTLCLGWAKGKRPGDPDAGHTLHEVDMGTPDAVRHRDVFERQRAAIQRFIDAGLVELVSTADEVDAYGRLSVLTTYRNLVTGKTHPVRS